MKFLSLEEAAEAVTAVSDEEYTPTLSILPNDERGHMDSETEDVNEDVIQTATESENVTGYIEFVRPSDDDDLLSGRSRVSWRRQERRSVFPNLSYSEPLDAAYPAYALLSPFEVFRLYMNDDFLYHIETETLRYAHEIKCDLKFSTSSDEIQQFLGIILYSGYVRLPQERDYWSTAMDFSLPFVASSMTRDRFQLLKMYLHLADNNNLGPSKCAKIQPVYDLMNRNLRQFGVFAHDLSIDESMVPYYGRHSTKQFLRGKPIRFGYKVWALCSSDGYPFQLDIYTGKDEQRKAPLGESVVMKFANLLEEPTNKTIYFDNFFTSYTTLDRLTSIGIRATGTIRPNRTNGCPLTKESLKNQNRGTYDYRSDGKILICAWKDSATVMLATNFDSVHPVRQCQRYSFKDHKKVLIDQPNVVREYNRKMGGVDIYDKLLGAYRPTIKGKKWWYNLFVNCLNTLVVASWKFYNYLHPSDHMSHLEFLRQVTVGLLKSKKTGRVRLGGRTSAVVSDVRKDQVGHFLESTSQGRCVFCQTNTRKKCGKCDKRLHINCFQSFHT